MKGFRDFIIRGNVVGLAVAFVMGAAFNAVVQSFVKDWINPLIAFALPSSVSDLQAAQLSSKPHAFLWGDFLYSVIYFLLVALVLYLFLVRPMAAWEARRAGEPTEKPTRPCPECLSDIPQAARRCAFCTAVVTPAG